MTRLAAPAWLVPLDAEAAADADLPSGLPARGAQLLELCRIGVPVQPGFVLTRALSEKFQRDGRLPASFNTILETGLAELQALTGTRLSDPHAPLLLGIVSETRRMHGPLDRESTAPIWPLGIDAAARRGLAHRTGSARFAWDMARRGVITLGTRACGIPERAFAAVRDPAAGEAERDLDQAERAWSRALSVFEMRSNKPFPESAFLQVRRAIKSELEQSQGGAALVVQAILLGNTGPSSGRGLVFTRDPVSGKKRLCVDFRPNMGPFEPAAFDDVGASSERVESEFPAVWRRLEEIAEKLERRFGDMQEFEFVIDGERLAVLSVRPARRSAPAALTVAVEMVKEGVATRESAVESLREVEIDRLVLDRVTGADVVLPLVRGTGVALGAAAGRLALSSSQALQLHRLGDAVIFVHEERAFDDLQGLAVARGVVLVGGGRSGPAATLARKLGIPAVLDCEDLAVDHAAACLRVGPQLIREGSVVTVDGNSGNVYAGELPIARDAAPEELTMVRRWMWEAGVKDHPLA